MNRQEIIQQIEIIQARLRQWQPPAVRRVLQEQLALHKAEVNASDYGGGGME